MGVAIRIPPDNEKSNIIRIEGNPEGVALAKKELLDMVTKMVGYLKRTSIIVSCNENNWSVQLIVSKGIHFSSLYSNRIIACTHLSAGEREKP